MPPPTHEASREGGGWRRWAQEASAHRPSPGPAGENGVKPGRKIRAPGPGRGTRSAGTHDRCPTRSCMTPARAHENEDEGDGRARVAAPEPPQPPWARLDQASVANAGADRWRLLQHRRRKSMTASDGNARELARTMRAGRGARLGRYRDGRRRPERQRSARARDGAPRADDAAPAAALTPWCVVQRM